MPDCNTEQNYQCGSVCLPKHKNCLKMADAKAIQKLSASKEPVLQSAIAEAGPKLVLTDANNEPKAIARVEPIGRTLVLHEIAVPENQQGKGFGQDMLKSLLAFAKAKGYRKMHVQPIDEKAEAWFAKQGFKPNELAGMEIAMAEKHKANILLNIVQSTKPNKAGMPGMPMEGRLSELTMPGLLRIMLVMPNGFAKICEQFGIACDDDLYITLAIANCSGFMAGQIAKEMQLVEPIEISFLGPAKLGNKLALLVSENAGLLRLRNNLQAILARHGLQNSMELEHGNWLAYCPLMDIEPCANCFNESMLKALNLCLMLRDDIIACDSLIISWQEAETPYAVFEQVAEPLLIGFGEGTVKPPAWMQNIAKRALAIRVKLPKSRRCCTAVGMKRANQIANGEPLSLRTLKRMKSFISRHLGQLRPGKHTLQDSKQLQALAAWASLDDNRTINWLDKQIAKLEGK